MKKSKKKQLIAPEIKEVSPAMRAFPASVIANGYLPQEEDVPEEYRKADNKWRELFTMVFFNVEKRDFKDLELYPKEGIDAEKAWRHVAACMGSYEPRHEHKEMGCAYLMGSWFEDWKWEKREQKENEKSISQNDKPT